MRYGTVPVGPLLLMLFSLGIASAQPTITGVVNSASNTAPGLPGSAIAEGSIFVIYGSEMGPAALAEPSPFPFPTSLSGTSLQVTVGGTTVTPFLVYTVASQVAAILPSSTPAGTGTITVTYNNQASAAFPINVATSAFGTYAVDQYGTGPGIITFPDSSFTGPTTAANPGETLIIWGTGLGPVTGDEAGGALPGNMPQIPLQVFIGGQLAQVPYQGRSGCCSGLDQISVVVPQGVSGCNVPLVVVINGVPGNTTSLAIAPSGRTCSDPLITQSQFPNTPNAKTGAVTIGRFSGTPTSATGAATFIRNQNPVGSLPADAVSFSYPAVGSCTVSAGPSPNNQQAINPGLDAGASIAVTGPGGSFMLKQQTVGTISYAGNDSSVDYSGAGTWTAAGTGGADVGPFSATISVPVVLKWMNPTAVANRAMPLAVSWSGGGPNQLVSIGGFSGVMSGASTVSASFNCLAAATDGTFTVPAYVLSSLPQSQTQSAGAPLGAITVVTQTTPAAFTASGLDYAAISVVDTSTASVAFQ